MMEKKIFRIVLNQINISNIKIKLFDGFLDKQFPNVILLLKLISTDVMTSASMMTCG